MRQYVAGNYRLAANSPLPTETGLWSVSPSAGIHFYPSPNDPNAFVSGLSPNSVYTFTWTVSNVCGSVSSSQVLTTGAFYSSSIPNGGADRCEAEGTTSILLQGNSEPGIQVNWTALTAGSQVTDPDSVVTQAIFTGGSGTYHFTYEMSSPGCTALIDTVSITINSLTYVNAGADISICTDVLPSSTALSVTLSNPAAASTGTWAQLSGPTTSQFSSYTELNPTVSGLMEGLYRFTYTLNSTTTCPSISDTVEVRVSKMPSQADAGADQSICNASTSTVLNLSASTPTIGNGYWQVISAPPGSSTPDLSDYTSPTSTIRNLTQGEYHLRWSVSNGIYCDASIDDLLLSISSAAYVGEDFNACNVPSINLVGNPNTTGTWEMISGNTGSTLVMNSSNTAIASNLQTTGDSAVYLFKYSIPATGNCPASFDELKFTNYAPPSIADGGDDRILCSNQTSILLTGNVPVNGSSIWKFISGPNVPSAGAANHYSYDSLLTNLVAGIYEMEYQTKSHPVCPVSSETILLLKETKAKTQANFRLCNDSIIHLSGNVPILAQGTWSVISAPAGNSPVFDNAQNPLTFVSGVVAGSYTFRWSIPGTGPCPGTHNDLNVIIDPPVDAPLAGSDTTFCQGSIQSLQLGGQANPGVSYAWSPAIMLDNPFSAHPNFTGTDNSGTYYYSVKASIGSCEAFSTVSIRVFPKPFVNIVIGDGGCAAIFEASHPGNGVNVAGYNWNFGTGVVPEAATGKGPHHVLYPTSGRRDVTLEILSDEGCHSDTAIEYIPLCVLPVKLVSFYAVWKAADAEISWEIEDAINLHYFEIERSFNGRDFSKIATVEHVNNQSNYTFLDYRISNRGTNIYYRLKSVDADGAYEYSPIRMLENNNSSRITIGPNPFHQFIKVYLSKDVFKGKVTASLYSAEGKRLQVKEAVPTGLSGEIIFENLLGLPPGTYMVVIIANEKRQTFKIIKK
ncbi:MAG: T9SS type A sorting domain-containing protein [Ferruginibacter sp.]|nr:T9SS type A sorting domain-containing protein [Ferruginibacter sp.]